MIEQRLLQFTQRFPVQQAGWPGQVAFATPAAGTGVQHQQGRLGRQAELPALKAQQLTDHCVLVVAGQCLALAEQRLAGVRGIAPGLAQQVAEQGIADDPS